MVDVRCPRCGSLMGRAEGKAQFRCHKARCFAIVNVDTEAGEMRMTRYGGGTNVCYTNKKFLIADVAKRHAEGHYKTIRF